MDSNPVILEISSDEDVGWGETDGGSGGGDTYDWLAELLREFDREEVDDSEEVTVIGEVTPKHRTNPLSAMKCLDADDDCVVLDGDPNSTVAVMNDSENGADDLLIVGEKGQIACRDYPHPRSLCVKFPFSSTPHGRHCDLCHCYVCDSLAPCAFWGTGISCLDHCHATDKEEGWKLKRKNSKEGNKDPVLTSMLSPLLPAPNFVPLHPPQSNPVLQSQVSGPTLIHACSSSLNSSIPKIINQGRTPLAGFNPVVRNRCQVPLISHHLHSTRNKTFQHYRGRSASNLGPGFISSRVISKMAGPVGSALTNRSSYSPSININRVHSMASQNLTRRHPLATPSPKNLVNCQGHSPIISSDLDSYQSSSQLNVGNILGYAAACQPQANCLPIPQPNCGEIPHPHENQTQTVVNSNFSDFDLCWPNDTGLSNQRLPEDPQPQSAVPTVEPSAVAEYDPNFPGLSKLDSVDFEIEDWMTENESVSGAPESLLPSELKALSPDPAPPIDPSMFLFDFETV